MGFVFELMVKYIGWALALILSSKIKGYEQVLALTYVLIRERERERERGHARLHKCLICTENQALESKLLRAPT